MDKKQRIKQFLIHINFLFIGVNSGNLQYQNLNCVSPLVSVRKLIVLHILFMYRLWVPIVFECLFVDWCQFVRGLRGI